MYSNMTDIANAINYGLPHLINNYYWICSFLFTWIVALLCFVWLRKYTHAIHSWIGFHAGVGFYYVIFYLSLHIIFFSSLLFCARCVSYSMLVWEISSFAYENCKAIEWLFNINVHRTIEINWFRKSWNFHHLNCSN